MPDVPAGELPDQPSLEQLRKQAKDLRRGVRASIFTSIFTGILTFGSQQDKSGSHEFMPLRRQPDELLAAAQPLDIHCII